MSTGRPP